MPVTDHAKLAPSASSRWAGPCPGSIRVGAQCPDIESEYAAEGTAAHELAEYCLNFGENAEDAVDMEFNGYIVDWEMANAVQVYLDEVRRLAPTDQIKHKLKLLNVEKRFHLEWVHPDIWGTNDCSVYNVMDHELTILDYKHGRGVVVEPENNSQLMIYAVGAMHALWESQTEVTRKVISVYKMVDTVRLSIVQPRAEHPDGPVRTWTTTAQHLMFWAANVLRIAALETEEPEAPLVAGKHCKFCKAIAICPARVEKNLAVANVEFSNPVLPEPSQLKPEHIIKVMEISKTLSNWAGQVKVYAQSQLESGFAIPGFKLVKRKANRKWTPIAYKQVPLLLGDSAFETPKMVSPAQAEIKGKLIGIKAKQFEDLWEKPDNGHTIAEDGDKRTAVAPAIDDFGMTDDYSFLE